MMATVPEVAAGTDDATVQTVAQEVFGSQELQQEIESLLSLYIKYVTDRLYGESGGGDN